MADDKSIRDAKAAALWSEVSPESSSSEPQDVKALINSVAAALQEKQRRAANQTSTKAQRREAKIAKKQRAQSSGASIKEPSDPVQKVDPGKAAELESALSQIELDISSALNAPTLISIATYRDLSIAYTSVKAKAKALYGDGTPSERLESIEDQLESVRVALNRNQEQHKLNQAARKAAARKALLKSAVGKARSGAMILSKGVSQARAFLLAANRDGGEPAKTNRDGVTPALLQPGQPKSAPVSAAPEARPTSVGAKSLRDIAKSAKATGQRVADVSANTFKWIGKHLKNLSSSLFRFLRSPLRGGGGITDLLGMGLLASALIKPMLEGVHAELKKQFGDDYVEKFIKGLWDKSWTFLVSQVKGFLGIKTEEDRAVEYAKDAQKATEAKRVAEAAHLANPTTETKKALDHAITEESRTKLAATVASNNVSSSSSSSKVVSDLSAKLDLYHTLKGARKTQSKTNIQNTLDDQVTVGMLPKELAANLKKEGFRVAPEKIQVTASAPPTQSSSSVGTHSSVTASPVPESPVSQASPPSTVSASPGTNSVSAPTPVVSSPPVGASEPVSSGPPMESSGPVTVKANPPQADGGGESHPGGRTGGGSSFTPGAAQIPTYMNDDSMMLFNSGVLTG
jgi:hypothetical protein